MTTPPQSRARTTKASIVAGIAGLISTMLGVGGGVVMVPLFALLGVMRVKKAASTSMVLVTVVVAIGLGVQLIHAPQDVHWGAALWLALGAFGGTFIGRWAHEAMPEMLFRYLFCIAMLFVAARMLNVLPQTDPLLAEQLLAHKPEHIAFLLVVGVFAGLVAVLFGLGGGVVVVPMLAIAFGYFDQNFTATRATSLAMILPTSIVGSILHLRMRTVDVPLVMKIMPFAALAAVGGVFLAYVIPTEALRVLFAVLLLLAMPRLLRRKFPPEAEKVKPATEVTSGEANEFDNNLEKPDAPRAE
jgi:uncharacterized protein